MENYLHEAFQAFKALDEDVFPATADGEEALKKKRSVPEFLQTFPLFLSSGFFFDKKFLLVFPIKDITKLDIER